MPHVGRSGFAKGWCAAGALFCFTCVISRIGFCVVQGSSFQLSVAALTFRVIRSRVEGLESLFSDRLD